MEEIIANSLNKPLLFGILCENVELAYQVRDSIIKFMESFPKITQLPFMSQNYEHIYVEQVKHWILHKNNNECYKRPTIDKRPTFNSGEILNYNILEGYNPNFSCNNKHIIKMLMFPRELKTHTFYIDVVELTDSDCPLSMNKIYPYLRTNFDAIYLFKVYSTEVIHRCITSVYRDSVFKTILLCKIVASPGSEYDQVIKD